MREEERAARVAVEVVTTSEGIVYAFPTAMPHRDRKVGRGAHHGRIGYIVHDGQSWLAEDSGARTIGFGYSTNRQAVAAVVAAAGLAGVVARRILTSTDVVIRFPPATDIWRLHLDPDGFVIACQEIGLQPDRTLGTVWKGKTAWHSQIPGRDKTGRARTANAALRKLIDAAGAAILTTRLQALVHVPASADAEHGD